MNILGVGPLELLIIAVIALIVLGPRGMTEFGRKAGRAVRKITRSSIWNDVVSTSRDINELPRKIMHDIDLEDQLHNIQTVATTSTPPDHKPVHHSTTQKPKGKQIH
ncbi:MAG: twin-arginine translocase TatA/TatE family subunit [Anaerolineaceae bacterium]